MTRADIMVFQANWPENIDIQYSQGRGLSRAFVYLLNDGEIHRLLFATKPFLTEEECRQRLEEFIKEILDTKFI